MKKILVINPGSTSTKMGYFEDTTRIAEETINHDKTEISKFNRVADQMNYRLGLIREWMASKGIKIEELDAISSRGGLLRAIPGGTYRISDKMMEDLLSAKYGEHASNLGAAIALKLAEGHNDILCTITDSTCTDELCEYARMSGCSKLPNVCIWHALNQKFVARKVARELGRSYEECNFIVTHMGGGISVGVHEKGRVVQVNDALGGAGPFSPERAGTIPRFPLIDMCFSGEYSKEQIKKLLNSNGGMMDYLGTNNMMKVEELVEAGDDNATLYFEGMCYHIAREIGAGATAISGKCDAIILTGGMAYSKILTDMISARTEFIAPVKLVPGSDENLALAEASYRAMTGAENIQEY